MEYAVGKTGRIIAARLFEGEDLYESIHEIAAAENVKSAAVLITGGFRRANVVVGPAQEKPRIIPDYKDFLGVGTIYCDDTGPKLHMHTAIGKSDQVMVGCPRDGTKTFLILEVTIIEIEGLSAHRKADENTGFNLLRFQ
ncbi:MAG: PPC domain-containing DNA-binding protein [Planctomycetota bacterium]|jgi:predicted DNA-binding protein with PD1-like motif